MKPRSLLCFLLVLLLLLTGCGTQTPTPGSDTAATAPDRSDDFFESTAPADDETDGSRERGSMVASKLIANAELGLIPTSIISSDLYVADAEPTKTGTSVAVHAYENGTAVLTAADYWGYTAEITVTVEDGVLKEVKVTKSFSDPKVINVKLSGVVGDGVADDTEAVQKLADSLTEGGVLLFPAGVYSLKRIVLGEGITLKLQGNVENPAEGYTDELAARVNSGHEFAVLKSQLMANNFILNHWPGTNEERLPGNLGKSNIAIEGGVIDLNGAIASGTQIDVNIDGPEARPACTNTCAIAFSYGENYRFENVIFKDGYCGHAIQFCGVRNAVVKDCMFAGCTIRPNVKGSSTDLLTTRETIQIEYAHTGAIPPSYFEPGEFYFCEDVTVSGCYFGKSDKAGYQMICIGQHGQNGTANCDRLTIENNVFDNPYIHALSLLNYTNVEITGNRFVSSVKGFETGNMIALNTNNAASTYAGSTKSGAAATVTNAANFEHDGLQNVNIDGNTFVLTKATNKRILYAGSTTLLPGARTVLNLMKRVPGETYGESFTGFLKSTNYIGNLSFVNNNILIDAENYRTDYYAALANIVGLRWSGNNITLAGGVHFSRSWNSYEGVYYPNILPESDVNGLTFVTSLKANYIYLPDGTGNQIKIASDGSSRTLKLRSTTSHLLLTYEINELNNVVVKVSVDDGFRFKGWQLENAAYTPGSTVTLTENLVLTAICQ